jgi:hypothetical protein
VLERSPYLARPQEALEEARIAARRDPRLHLPPILEALVQAALGRTELAQGALMSARRLRPELTQQEIERSHGRRAAKILSGVWDVIRQVFFRQRSPEQPF